jgi:hypothetical protein
MKQIILMAIALMFFGGGVGAEDSKGNFTYYNAMSCSSVLSAHAGLKILPKGYSGNHNTWEFVGWIQGYVTAVNQHVRGKSNYFSSMDSLDIANWVASWCRSNPTRDIVDAVSTFSKSRIKK